MRSIGFMPEPTTLLMKCSGRMVLINAETVMPSRSALPMSAGRLMKP